MGESECWSVAARRGRNNNEASRFGLGERDMLISR